MYDKDGLNKTDTRVLKICLCFCFRYVQLFSGVKVTILQVIDDVASRLSCGWRPQQSRNSDLMRCSDRAKERQPRIVVYIV